MPNTTDGPCCWLGLCCPPAEQAAALADHFGGLDPNYARRIVDAFVLVPRVLDPVTETGDPVPVSPVNPRLTALLDHIASELPAILEEQGYPSKAEG